VKLIAFGPELKEIKTPRNIGDAMEIMRAIPSGYGMTDIGAFFRVPDVANADTLIIISDGEETAGAPAESFIRKIQCKRVVYIKVGGGGWQECITESLKKTEIDWKMVEMTEMAQLDQIVPMLAYNDFTGNDDAIKLMHDYLMGESIPTNICAACHEEIHDIPVHDSGYVFHLECLKNWWDLLGSNRRKIWHCDHCNAKITADTKECPNCGGSFQSIVNLIEV
jgi:hypothetical protein